MNLDATNQQKWSDLLVQAVTQPGLILKAYSAFHGYSLGNQLAALLQCHRHGIEPLLRPRLLASSLASVRSR